jgi:phosphoglycerate dehydrogenase-like enzyme
MNIFYTSIEPEILDKHRKQLEDIGNLNLVPGNKLSEQDIIKKLKDADILVVAPSSVSKVNKKILNSLPKLKFITTVTTGYDWIDVKEAARLGIKVSTVKGANAESVAEHTWAMILDLAKRVTEFDRDTRFKGASDFTKYKGLEVCGKTLGVLG